jgi:hypothetical protein
MDTRQCGGTDTLVQWRVSRRCCRIAPRVRVTPTVMTSCIHNKFHAEHMVCKPDSVLFHGEEPPLGAHLISPRAFYEHHGIYVGGGCVIHYAGLTNRRWRGPVEEVSLVDFANGHPVRVRHDQRLFTCAEVVKRARSRLGERRYRIFTNNCEHFCAWVLREDCRSTQVEELRRLPRNLYCALLAALAVTRPTIKVPTGRPLVLSTGEQSVETESLAGN